MASAAAREAYMADLREKGGFRDRAFVMTNKAGAARHVMVSVEQIAFRGEPHYVGFFDDITDRKHADETVHRQAVMLANAQRIGCMGSFSLDLRTGALVWPSETCHLFGITPEQFEGTFEQFRGLVLPEDLPGYDAACARLSPLEPLLEVEYRIRRPDGAVRWLYSRGRVEYDPAGLPLSRTGMVTDVTDQHAAREQLAENAALLRIAGRVARLGGWTIQLPSRTLTWSDENCAIHDVPSGYEPTLDEGIEFYPPEYRADVLRHVEACELDGTPYDFELPKLTATGRRIWVRSIGEALRDAEGRIVRLQGAFQDITARKQNEAATRDREAAFRMRAESVIHDLEQAQEAALASERAHRELAAQLNTERARLVAAQKVASVGSWETDLATGAILWSAETYRIFGRDPEAFHPTHHGFMQLIHPDDRASVDEAFARSLDRGLPGAIEHRLLTPDGRIKSVEERWHVVRGKQGEPAHAIGTCQDISARKQAEEEMRLLELQYLRAQRMESIGTLAGGIAHDLNNVLAPILLSIGVLQQDEHDPARLGTLETIEASAKRGAAMISRVLSFARGMESKRVEVQVAPLVRDLATIVRETFPKNIVLAVHLDPDLWTLDADTTQLHQVLLNLCVNARDAMTTGGQLTITARNVVIDDAYAALNIDARAGPHVMIDIEDTGTGMSKGVMDQIFDPFFTTKELGQGTGLGLATSLAIVKGHQGSIRAESTPGTGSRFRLYLPARTTAVAQVPAVGRAGRPRGNGETVLVVDDEALLRRIAQRTLETFGYRVLLAGDGAEAVALYAEHQAIIAVVLTDMMMPVMDGPATIRELVRLNPDVRIVATSGLAAADDVKGPAGSLAHFLAKPYSAETLLTAIRDALA